MRKIFIFFCVFLLSVSLFAQVRTGNIYGRVADTEGNPLPGVTVKLTGIYTAPMTTVTSAEGSFRFLSLPPARDYTVRLELTGFKTKIEESIIVTVGGNTNLTITMELGMVEEEITVTAISPVVDTKKTSVGANVTQDVLQSLPTARDPWVILQMMPGVIADRENIGGTESGMQSTMTARGASGYSQNVWAMDGVVITDPAAIGASPSYYDFDAFEEMQITVGGADVTVQTGGIALNLVTRRGGNRVSLGGRFYYTDGLKFQGDNMTDAFRAEGLARVNKIRIITDYGFNLGVPIVKDKAWFWGSFGVQDIQTNTADGNPFDTMLTNFAAKLNLQLIPANRFEAFIHAGKKEMWGRGSSPTFPPGVYQGGAYHFGSPIIKFQDEHMFGDNLFLSAKYSWSNAGFTLTSEADRERKMLRIWDVAQARYYNVWYNYVVNRPHTQGSIQAQYFNDTLFGVSHEIKVGAEYSFRGEDGGYLYPGQARMSRNYNTLQIDFDGDGIREVPPSSWRYFSFHRSYERERRNQSFAGFFSDTISFGRFNVLLGVRYDHQIPKINPFTIAAVEPDHPVWQEWATSQTATLLDGLLPGIDIPSVKATSEDGRAYAWKVLSPRLGFVWNVTGDGKTLAKLSLAQYGDFMGMLGYWMPGGTSGSLGFWWYDQNADNKIGVNEMYWLWRRTPPTGQKLWQPYRIFGDAGNFTGNVVDAAGLYWSGYDFNNPTQLTDPYAIVDAKAGSSRTSEAILTLEREVFTDLAVSVNATYRRFDHFNWDLKYFPSTGVLESANWYVSAGSLPSTLPGIGSTKEAANNPYYYAIAQATAYSDWYKRQIQPDRYNDFYAVDLIFNKRLSNKWMMNANFTLQTQGAHYGAGGTSNYNPTNVWAYNGQPYSPLVGSAAGKINQYTWSRWLFKASGLYQLPYGFNVSFNFNAREGWFIREYINFIDRTTPNPLSQGPWELDLTTFATERLPTFYNLSLRLEKEIRTGDFGRIYLMCDVFNALNTAVENRRYQKYHGTFEYYGPDHPSNRFTPDPNFYRLNEILNPRVFRLGVRFQF